MSKQKKMSIADFIKHFSTNEACCAFLEKAAGIEDLYVPNEMPPSIANSPMDVINAQSAIVRYL